MKLHHPSTLIVGIIVSLAKLPAHAQMATTVDQNQVCVTNGELLKRDKNLLTIESPSSRAVAKSSDSSYAAIEFEYLGPTKQKAPLASGRIVRQLGVKLRSRSCNSIYIMWNVEEDSGLKISKQVNPNKFTHAECGVKGYKSLYESKPGDFAPIHIGETRRLEATLDGRFLLVNIDGANVWRGDVGADAASLSGYSGVRTDNVRMRFRWLTKIDQNSSNKSIESKPPIPTCKPISSSAALRD